LVTELDDIKGVGPETAKLLLRELKSVKKIKEADLPLLVNIIGASKGTLVWNHFHQNKLL